MGKGEVRHRPRRKQTVSEVSACWEFGNGPSPRLQHSRAPGVLGLPLQGLVWVPELRPAKKAHTVGTAGNNGLREVRARRAAAGLMPQARAPP